MFSSKLTAKEIKLHSLGMLFAFNFSCPHNIIVLLDIIRVAVVAFACLNLNPRSRPEMKCMSKSFVTKLTPLSIPLSGISVQQLMSQELKTLFHIGNR